MDVLTDLLSRARARGAVFAHSTLRAPWGLEFEDHTPLSVHAVLEGELHVAVAGAPGARCLQGDLVLVRSGEPYRLMHAPRAAVRPLAALIEQGRVPGQEGRYALGGGGEATVLLCGAYSFEGGLCDGLLGALPPLIVLRGAAVEPSLRSALGLLADEVGRGGAGQQAVLDRLLDLILVYALRTWFHRDDAGAPPWFCALDDPPVGAALRAMHADPARAWTVEALAAEAGLSRAAFARRFGARVGEPPLAYLTRWRMTLAADALLAPGATVASVAPEVGYASGFAFAAAFKRHHGVPPGRWRRERRLPGAGRAASTG
jgi:AraC-like DNA-binding protein